MVRIEFDNSTDAFINLDVERANDWYLMAEEISRILSKISNEIVEGYDHNSILDLNGNKIGSWEVTREI